MNMQKYRGEEKKEQSGYLMAVSVCTIMFIKTEKVREGEGERRRRGGRSSQRCGKAQSSKMI